jgi:hypothetical protein
MKALLMKNFQTAATTRRRSSLPEKYRSVLSLPPIRADADASRGAAEPS